MNQEKDLYKTILFISMHYLNVLIFKIKVILIKKIFKIFHRNIIMFCNKVLVIILYIKIGIENG